ncbi:MAG TPA: hypothetical protein VL359_20195 [bacterium]|nr:hypothetical protein [bacterium]
MRPAHGPVRGPVLGLVPGVLLFDVLLNLPAFTPAEPVRSLLAPSIDLLVVAAACMGVAQAGPGPQRPLRIGLAALTAALAAAAAGLRFGWGAAGHLFGGDPGGSLAMAAAAGWALCVLVAAAVGLCAFVASGPVVRGMQPRVARSVLLLVIALAAVLQVVTGHRVFTPSVIPRLIALFG